MADLSSTDTLARHARWLNLQARHRGDLPPLFFMTDESRTPDPLSIVRNLPSATGVILRHYSDRRRDILARDLVRECRKRNLLFLVAGNPGMARDVGADGVHVPEWQIYKLSRYRREARLRFITASAHTLPSLIEAGKSGASAVFVAPVFGTTSHPGRPHLGVTRLASYVCDSVVPVYALGGITVSNSMRLKGTGVAGISSIGAFL